MAYKTDYSTTVKNSSNGLRKLFESIDGNEFETWLASDSRPQKNKIYEVHISHDDVMGMSKYYWAKIVTLGQGKKGVEVFVPDLTNNKKIQTDEEDKKGNPIFLKGGMFYTGGVSPDDLYRDSTEKRSPINGWRVRFKETGAKVAATDGKHTAKQEAGSAYIFERALATNGWGTLAELKADKSTMKGLKEIYPELPDDWVDVYWKQHQVILNKFRGSQIREFKHKGGFMKYIGDLVVRNFGFSKKDNWNPADIWGIKNEAKVISIIEESVGKSQDSQTIEELNALLRGMYKNDTLVGISLKKVSGKEARWEEFNLDKITVEELDEYRYPDITMQIQLGKNMATDSIVWCKQGSGSGYKFQIRQNSKGASNLKFESTKMGATAARGGKAQVDMVVRLLNDKVSNNTFTNNHNNYPKNKNQFLNEKKPFVLDTWESMFEDVNKVADTGISTKKDFVDNISNLFDQDADVANSKLMQLTFLYNATKITPKKNKENFWTDMVFLSIKKGDKYGPFGKLY